MLTVPEATKLVTELQNQWIDGLRRGDYAWLETHLADDFLFTAHPLPAIKLSKREFIDMDKKIRNPQIKFVSIHAEPVGELILSRTVADVKEEFDADLGPGMPAPRRSRGWSPGNGSPTRRLGGQMDRDGSASTTDS